MRTGPPSSTRSPGDRSRLAWGWRLAGYVALLLLLTVSLQLVVILTSGVDAASPLDIRIVGAAVIAALAASWVMMSRVESRPPAALGLVPGRRALGDFARGCVVGCALVGATCGLMVVAGWLNPSEVVAARPGSPESVLDVTALLLLAAFLEELAVRGYPFQVLAEARGPAIAVGATALVFGALHGANPGVGRIAIVNTILAGILLGIMYWRTLSLWLVTGAHLAWNWTMGVAVGLPVSGLDVRGDGETIRVGGPETLTGGDYGPEGGALLGLVTLAGILWLAKSSHLTRDPAVLALSPLPVSRIRSEGSDARSGGSSA